MNFQSNNLRFFRSEYHDPVKMKEDFLYILYATIAWTSYFIVVKFFLFKKRFIINGKQASDIEDKDLKNRMVSFIHGLVSCIVSSYHCSFLKTECGALNLPYQRNALIFSISYFLWDTFAMYFEGLLDNAMIIHHSLCILGLTMPLYENISANFVMQVICIMEVSNPPMTIRHFFRLTGRRYTKGYEIVEISFIIIYCFARSVLAFPLLYYALRCQHNHMFLKFIVCGLMI